MTKTIILSPRFSSDSQDLWRAANNSGWNIHRAINHIPPVDTGNCCVYGELMFCDIMANRCNLGLLDPPDDFLWHLTFCDVKRKIFCCNKDDSKYFFTQLASEKVFVQPANDNVFQYGIYHNYSDIPLRYVDDECPMIMSTVVSWETEVRLYCLDHKVVTAGAYRYIGDRAEEQELKEAEEFGNKILTKYWKRLPSAVVLDVGRISDVDGWAVVEANQAYASGIYQEADPVKILDVVYRSAGNIGKVIEHDKQFLRNND